MKRGQMAMEFLMTYGWVILVVLVGISALAYFGVLNPGKNIPDSCIFFPGISCDDFKVDTNSVTMVITNGGGSNFENVSFTVLGTGPCSGDSSSPQELKSGQKKTFIIICTQRPDSGSAFRREVQINYKEFEGLSHSRLGQVHTNVE